MIDKGLNYWCSLIYDFLIIYRVTQIITTLLNDNPQMVAIQYAFSGIFCVNDIRMISDNRNIHSPIKNILEMKNNSLFMECRQFFRNISLIMKITILDTRQQSCDNIDIILDFFS